MKRIVSLITIFMIVLTCAGASLAEGSIAEKPEIKIIIDGKQGTYTNVPIMVNGRTLLPLREILTNLGVPNDDEHIIWNGAESSVTVIKDTTKIYLKVGSNKAAVNGTETILEAAPVKYKDRVFIPARFVAESFDKEVGWDEETNSVIIKDKNEEIKEVTVSTTQELVNELGSNKRVILKAGVYDFSSVKQENAQGSSVTWEDVYDGKELNLKNVKNLTIEGAEASNTEIRVSPRYALIMNFSSCKNIAIKNITAGHTPAEYECDAGVLGFSDCEDITIDKSHLYGCGSMGLDINNTKRLTCSDTVIDHCSLRAVDIFRSETIKFKGCKILNHEAYSNIVMAFSSKGISFEDCEISNNNNFGWNFIEIFDNTDITISKCKITNNSRTSDPLRKNDIVHFFLVGGNDDSRITVKDSTISNNKCDFLTNNKDKVTFENCTMTDNEWK